VRINGSAEDRDRAANDIDLGRTFRAVIGRHHDLPAWRALLSSALFQLISGTDSIGDRQPDGSGCQHRRQPMEFGWLFDQQICHLAPLSAPFAQQPGTPEPPGTPPQPPPDPTAPPPYEEPPRPIPIPRPDEPPVVDDPPPPTGSQVTPRWREADSNRRFRRQWRSYLAAPCWFRPSEPISSRRRAYYTANRGRA
jgi:hypothetical protein